MRKGQKLNYLRKSSESFKYNSQARGKIIVDVYCENGKYIGKRYFTNDNFERLFKAVENKKEKKDE